MTLPGILSPPVPAFYNAATAPARPAPPQKLRNQMDSKEIKKRPTLEQIRSHMLHNETKEQSPTRIPGYFCAPTTNVVPRKGGPKEARLYRVRDMANLERDPLFDTYTPIRVSNVDPETATETVYEIFSRYGKIGNIFRPTSKSFSLVPAPYIFVRYVTKESADIAIREMNGKMIKNRQIFVVTAEQDSFFTMDTGYITNEALDHPEVPKPPFDTTLSSSHYSHLRAEEIRDLDVTFNIRVDDIHPHITPEILRHVFRYLHH